MASAYDAALAALYQAPHRAFVAERNRLAAELKSAGDRAGAARLRQLRRPPLSAWAVNQLYWRERGIFDALMHSAERLRAGDLSMLARHRNALAALREQAAVWLTREGHSASNATLERVTTTLVALAAAGTFDPDPPGALSTDREPTGFDFAPRVITSAPRAQARAKEASEPVAPTKAERGRAARQRAEQQRAETAAKRRQAKQEAERRQLAASLRDAERELAARAHERDRLRRELARAEAALERARAARDALTARAGALEE